ncbi:metallo-beta-lactamase family protein [Tanacetum coccineum]
MATCHHLSGATWRKHCSPTVSQPPSDHRSTTVVNGGQHRRTTGQWRRSTTVNGGGPPLTIAGPPVNGGRPPVKAGQQLGRGPGQVGSWGLVCLFYKPLKVLFTGDHLALEDSELYISEEYNFYSVPIQLDSVAKLIELAFEWILPGRRIEFKDVEEKNATIKAF